jgi:hypothetical protein
MTVEQNALANLEKQRRLVATTALRSLKQDADQTIRLIDALDEELSTWGQQVEPLLANDTGKLIAADRDCVKAFTTIYNDERITRDDAVACRARVAPILQHAEDALDDPGSLYQPDAEVRRQLDTVKGEVSTALASYREARQMIEGLIADARQAGSPASISLREAIARVNEGYVSERIRVLSAARDEEERRTTTELEALQRQKDGEIREAQKKRLAAQSDAAREDIETEAFLTAKQSEEKNVRRLAESDAVQADYAAFLADGRTMFGDHGSTAASRLQRPGPASFKMLAHLGVFADVEAFAQARSKGGLGRHNDRPTKPMPQTQEQWAACEKDFELFKKLAPVWLDMGKLQP